MKTHALQMGIISVSASLLLAAGLSFFGALEETVQTNTLNDVLDSTGEESTVPLSYETRIAKGDQLFRAEYYQLAANEYALASKVDEKQEEAHTKLGKTYLKLSDYERAIHEFERAFELNPNDNTRSNYGLALLRNKNFELAGEILSQVSQENQPGVFVRAMLKAYQGDYETAKQGFAHALELSGPTPTQHIQNFVNAFQAYDSQQGGQTLYLRALLMKAYIDAEEYPMAEELALQVLNEKNDYRDVWILLGYAQLKTKKYEQAEDAFKEAKRLDAVKPETHYFLGMAHFKQEEYTEAVKSFELALLYGFEPEAEAYRQMAESQTSLGNYEDALAAYEYLTKIDHANLELFTAPIHLALEKIVDLDRALTLAQEATSYFPSEPKSHTLLSEVYLKRGEFDLGVSAAETALAIDSSFAEAHYSLAQLKLAQEKPEEAKNEFKKAYELSKPGDALSIEAAKQYNALIMSPNP